MTRRVTNNRLKLLFSSLIISSLVQPVYAADPPPLPQGAKPGDILQPLDINKLLQQKDSTRGKPLLEPRIPLLPPKPEEAQKTIFIKGFKISHNTAIDSATLLNLIESYSNQELSLHQMQEITSILTRHYREAGYFVARAYVPEQTLADDILEIAILEGRHGEFKLNNKSLVNDKTALGFLSVIQPNQLVHTQGLERQLLLLDDLSGTRVASSDVSPGKTTGTSDFLVELDETRKYLGYATLDNYGTKYTGVHRLGVGMNINSLTGIGDTLSLSAMASETTNLLNFGVNYSRHLGYTGWQVGVGTSYSTYDLDMLGMGDLESYGTSLGINAFASYPFIKTHNTSRTLTFSSSYQMMEDTSFDKEQKSSFNLGAQLSERRPTYLFSLPGSFVASLGYTLGNLSLDNEAAKFSDMVKEAEGFFHKLTFSLGHQQYLVKNLSLQTSLRAQQNLGNNLDGSERMSVGGSNGVRAYEDSEQSGDSAITLSLDLIYNLPRIKSYAHNVYLFADHAQVKINSKNADLLSPATPIAPYGNERDLTAVGIGYSLSYKNFDLKTSYGVGLGNYNETSIDKKAWGSYTDKTSKFIFQAIYRF